MGTVPENVNIFRWVCKHVSRYGVNCVFSCRSYIKFDICNVSSHFWNFSSFMLKVFLASNCISIKPKAKK